MPLVRLPELAVGLLVAAALASASASRAQSEPDPAATSSPQRYALHGQVTVVEQALAGFPSPYSGDYSLDPAPRGRETMNATLFAGFSPWSGGQIWINPEVGQGLALSDSKGVASYLNAEAPRGGSSAAYFRIQRLFLAQTFNLGGKPEVVDGEENELRGVRDTNRLVVTLGKFSVADIFDANDYAHDSQEDFLNGSILIAGSFDFAGDYNGYTYGAATELYQGPWTLRLGVFDLTTSSGDGGLDSSFGEFQMVAEAERRFSLGGHAGSLKITGFDSRARMGDYAAAVRLGLMQDEAPDVFNVRRYRNRGGVSLNLQQELTDGLGAFVRAGFADGHVQNYEFADIDRSISAGLVLSGDRWGRDDDAIGLAGAVNTISPTFISYLDHGGLGLAIGDGRLPHPGSEGIVECFYKWAFSGDAHVTLDYQLVVNPAYNRDRGPASVFALRIHAAL